MKNLLKQSGTKKQVKEGTKMSRLNLQIALDHNDLEHALEML